MISMTNTANILKNRINDRDSYDINRAAKDIATKTLKKTVENSKKQ